MEKSKKINLLEAKEICVNYLNNKISNFEKLKKPLPEDILKVNIFTPKEKLVEYLKIIEEHQKLIEEMIETQKFAKYSLGLKKITNKHDNVLNYKLKTDTLYYYLNPKLFKAIKNFLKGYSDIEQEDKLKLVLTFFKYILINNLKNILEKLETPVELPEKYFLKENS